MEWGGKTLFEETIENDTAWCIVKELWQEYQDKEQTVKAADAEVRRKASHICRDVAECIYLVGE